MQSSVTQSIATFIYNFVHISFMISMSGLRYSTELPLSETESMPLHAILISPTQSKTDSTLVNGWDGSF